MERSRQWAMRCIHEAKMHEHNCFITLTYNDEHLPDQGNLEYEPFQKFMKRLRKRFTGIKIRFFMCGEYGEKQERPHYHACLFGVDFPDKKVFKKTSAGSILYTSETLNKLWQDGKGESLGFATIGDVSFESAAYVARYMMKKNYGKSSKLDYQVIDQETGQTEYLNREFIQMSRRPGIGSTWFEKWKDDVFPADHVIMNGREVKPPRYYTQQLKKRNPKQHEEVSSVREQNAYKYKKDSTEERLLAREICTKAALQNKRREIC